MFKFLGDKVFSANNVGERGMTWGDVAAYAAAIGILAVAVIGGASAPEHPQGPQPTPVPEAPQHQ